LEDPLTMETEKRFFKAIFRTILVSNFLYFLDQKILEFTP
jgi:hypothetical protein